MYTKAILAAAAAAFLLANSPAFAHEMASGDTKRCYRTVHKLPYRLSVPCPKPKEQPAPGNPVQPNQQQKPPAPPAPQNQ